MLFRTQIFFCSSELRLHFRIAEVGSLLSLNRAWRAQVTLREKTATLPTTALTTPQRATIVDRVVTRSGRAVNRPARYEE